jgi:hypothetical protein
MGGAPSQEKGLALCWEAAEFTPAAKQESARRLLGAWQGEKHRRGPANLYVSDLNQVAHDFGKPIDVGDLPALRSR